eukprot:scaffold86_cov338-Pavlova_lutheri.AAC.74
MWDEREGRKGPETERGAKLAWIGGREEGRTYHATDGMRWNSIASAEDDPGASDPYTNFPTAIHLFCKKGPAIMPVLLEANASFLFIGPRWARDAVHFLPLPLQQRSNRSKTTTCSNVSIHALVFSMLRLHEAAEGTTNAARPVASLLVPSKGWRTYISFVFSLAS